MPEHRYPAESWLTPHARVGQSRIEGQGLFATRYIREGEIVMIITVRRPIPAGAEPTIDYATHTGVETWTMPCRCGSRLCRATVTGSDWRLPELQVAYHDHWTPPLLARINRGPGACRVDVGPDG